MIGIKLKPVVCALTIGSAAISNAGCNIDGAVDSLMLEADSAAQYAAVSGAAAAAKPGSAVPDDPAGDEHPTHAEVRHFAIYSRYRSMVDSSGGSGVESSYRAVDEESGNFILWGSRLLGIEHFFCPADSLGK